MKQICLTTLVWFLIPICLRCETYQTSEVQIMLHLVDFPPKDSPNKLKLNLVCYYETFHQAIEVHKSETRTPDFDSNWFVEPLRDKLI